MSKTRLSIKAFFFLFFSSCALLAQNNSAATPDQDLASPQSVSSNSAVNEQIVITNSDLVIPLVTVGDPGNTADPDTGYGAVKESFSIGIHDVTAAEYCEFLNAVAAHGDPFSLYDTRMGMDENVKSISYSKDQNGLYSYFITNDLNDPIDLDRGQFPITYVNLYSAIRFCNWLQNGKPFSSEKIGITETGAYSTLSASPFVRNPNATWFIPTEDELYKSTYYKGGSSNAGYYPYPNRSSEPPKNDPSNQEDANNEANYYCYDGYTTGNAPYRLTAVGFFTQSKSPYGAFDTGGNVAQWTTTEDGRGTGSYVIRGGSWASPYSIVWSNDLQKTTRSAQACYVCSSTVGFRVASSLTTTNPSSPSNIPTAPPTASQWTTLDVFKALFFGGIIAATGGAVEYERRAGQDADGANNNLHVTETRSSTLTGTGTDADLNLTENRSSSGGTENGATAPIDPLAKFKAEFQIWQSNYLATRHSLPPKTPNSSTASIASMSDNIERTLSHNTGSGSASSAFALPSVMKPVLQFTDKGEGYDSRLKNILFTMQRHVIKQRENKTTGTTPVCSAIITADDAKTPPLLQDHYEPTGLFSGGLNNPMKKARGPKVPYDLERLNSSFRESPISKLDLLDQGQADNEKPETTPSSVSSATPNLTATYESLDSQNDFLSPLPTAANNRQRSGYTLGTALSALTQERYIAGSSENLNSGAQQQGGDKLFRGQLSVLNIKFSPDARSSDGITPTSQDPNNLNVTAIYRTAVGSSFFSPLGKQIALQNDFLSPLPNNRQRRCTFPSFQITKPLTPSLVQEIEEDIIPGPQRAVDDTPVRSGIKPGYVDERVRAIQEILGATEETRAWAYETPIDVIPSAGKDIFSTGKGSVLSRPGSFNSYLSGSAQASGQRINIETLNFANSVRKWKDEKAGLPNFKGGATSKRRVDYTQSAFSPIRRSSNLYDELEEIKEALRPASNGEGNSVNSGGDL